MTTRDQIDKKKDEYIAYLIKAIKSESIIEAVTSGVRNKYESDLSALKSQLSKEPEMYPEEFVEWIGLECGFHSLTLREIDMKWVHPLVPISLSDKYTLAELHTYWKDIKDK